MATSLAVISMAGMELITLQHYQRDARLTEQIGGEEGVDANINVSNTRMAKVLLLSRTGGLALVAILSAAILLKIASKLMDPQRSPSFLVILGAVSLAAYPFALLRFVVTTGALMAISDRTALNLENVASLNLGQIMDRDASSRIIYSIATSFDLVNIAQLLFTAFGFSKITGFSFTRALTVCGAIWAIFILWKAALEAFF